MSLDNAVDSVQLNNGLSAICNAIRAKNGGTEHLTFPSEIADAIAAIETGITPSGSISISDNGTYDVTDKASAVVNVNSDNIDFMQYCTVAPQFGANYPSATPHIIAPICKSFYNMFYYASSHCPYTDITVESNAQVTSLGYLAENYLNASELKTVTLNISDLSKCTSYQAMFKNNNGLCEILGSPLDFSSVTNANSSSWGNTQAKVPLSIRYKPNTLHVNHNISGEGTLTQDSIISIANGLKFGNHTLALHANVKVMCTNLRGTVSQEEDGDVTYDFFTADTSGAVTLENFITQTKGWTIA